ncbi:MAG: hypothetical protein WCC57_15445, partial [Paracoccaceae bacterium]
MNLSALPIILHVGPPKTGTTTLQHHCFPNLANLCFVGKPWFHPHLPYDICVGLHKAIDAISLHPEGRYDATATRAGCAAYFAALEGYLDQTHGPGHFARSRFVLSEERLCHEDTVSIEVLAQRLAAVFPAAEVAYVKRDPIPALISGYIWLYTRAWVDGDVRAWVHDGLAGKPGSTAAIMLHYYDYPRTEAAFARHFNTVRHANLPDLRANPDRFFADLLGPGADGRLPEFTADIHSLAAAGANASRNRIICELHRSLKKAIRLWNRLPLQKIDEKPEYIGEGGLWPLIEPPLSHLRWGQTKFTLTPEDQKAITAYYTEKPRHDGS